MAEYTSNSHKSKELVEIPAEKKLDPVVSGSVKIQKKSGLAKFFGSFIADGIENVGSSLWFDVVVPYTKKLLDDLATNAVHMVLYGKTAESKGVSASKISYNSFYNKYNSEPVRAGSNSSFDIDTILYSTRGDAEAVLEAMDDIIERYGFVTVSTYYEISDVQIPPYTKNKYGWKSVVGAKVRHAQYGDGYVIDLPRAVLID